MSLRDDALKLHRENQGKFEISAKVPLQNARDLSLAYSPGVAEPCLEIHKDKEMLYEYTSKGNMVAVITNGTAVLGLGNIGASAALPVMEGKAVLFKAFAGVDAIPICLDTEDTEKIIETVKLLSPSLGGVNLEDIGAPACFEIEERLKRELDIPVFHDDQHGTAIVTLAALLNATRLTGRKLSDLRVVINGAGAAGIAVVRLLYKVGVKDMIMRDTRGAIYKGRLEGMNAEKEFVADLTNQSRKTGTLADVLAGTDVFIGVSAADVVSPEMVRSMNENPLIFAMANPNPEITPDLARSAGAAVIGTGRSDFPNQINNVLAFPGIFRGALDVRAREINDEMKIAAAHAIASLVEEADLAPDYIIPNPFDKRVAPAVAEAVSNAAITTGAARIPAKIRE